MPTLLTLISVSIIIFILAWLAISVASFIVGVVKALRKESDYRDFTAGGTIGLIIGFLALIILYIFIH